MTNQKEISGTYENRLLLFVDFMGFSEFIDQTTRDSNKISYLHRLLDVTSQMLTTIKSLPLTQLKVDQSRLTCRMFSDTITVSLPFSSEDDLSLITSWACILQYTIFSTSDFFLRGSIVYSGLYDYDNKIFGPALVNAYNLEDKHAIWPRIILKDDFINLHKERNPYVAYIKEGEIYFLDYLTYLFRILGVNEFNGLNRSSNFNSKIPGPLGLLKEHKEKIESARVRTDNSELTIGKKEERLQKYNELAKYHNSVLDSFCLIVDNFLSDRALTYDICRATFKQAYLEGIGDNSFKSPYTVENAQYGDKLPIFYTATKNYIFSSTPPLATKYNGISSLEKLIDNAANLFFNSAQTNLRSFKTELLQLKLP